MIGTMNEYRKHLKYMADVGALGLDDLHSLSLKISATPSLVMPGVWPQDVTMGIFGDAPMKKLVRSSPKLTLVDQLQLERRVALRFQGFWRQD